MHDVGGVRERATQCDAVLRCDGNNNGRQQYTETESHTRPRAVRAQTLQYRQDLARPGRSIHMAGDVCI